MRSQAGLRIAAIALHRLRETGAFGMDMNVMIVGLESGLRWACGEPEPIIDELMRKRGEAVEREEKGSEPS